MSAFFALLLRMRYIDRWALMRGRDRETLSEHVLETALIAHGLAVIRNTYFAQDGVVDADRAAVRALFHDAAEVITGDMPTPVKYHSPALRAAYKTVEENAVSRLLDLLPQPLRGTYAALLPPTDEDAALEPYVKAADKLSALHKCMAEEAAGNTEFAVAKETIMAQLHGMDRPEIRFFLDHFCPSFAKPLDDLLCTEEDRATVTQDA